MKIFLDSSVLVAYLIKSDLHYRDAHSLIDFIHEKYQSNNFFVLNEMVILETVSRLVYNGVMVKNAIKMIECFVKKHKIYIILRDTNEFLQTIYDYYEKFSRKKIKKLKSKDFLIICDAIKTKSILVTCDVDFLKYTTKNFKDVYFISSKSKKYKDQYLKLLSRLFN